MQITEPNGHRFNPDLVYLPWGICYGAVPFILGREADENYHSDRLEQAVLGELSVHFMTAGKVMIPISHSKVTACFSRPPRVSARVALSKEQA